MLEKQAWWEFEEWLANNSGATNEKVWKKLRSYSVLISESRRKARSDRAVEKLKRSAAPDTNRPK